jgi:hypothetical protein
MRWEVWCKEHETHVWINLWSMEWQNSIKTASHQLQQYIRVRTTEYIDHLIKEAIEVWVNMENFNVDVCCTLSKACCPLPNMLCSQKRTWPVLLATTGQWMVGLEPAMYRVQLAPAYYTAPAQECSPVGFRMPPDALIYNATTRRA